jgi:hypothetical protein
MVLVCLVLLNASGKAQTTTLSNDAEFLGALLDSTRPITFYKSGNLEKGILKSDYQVKELTFEAGTELTFYEDGGVSSGYIKSEVKINNLTFIKGLIQFHPNGIIMLGQVKAGSNDANLVLPVDSGVNFDVNGKVLSLTPRQSNLIYRLLGRSVFEKSEVFFDSKQNLYKLWRGSAGAPQLIARLATQRNSFGHPTAALPVVVPAFSSFQLLTINPAYASGQQTYDNWKYAGPFQINGYNFGNNPFLFVKDMRLVGVQITQALTIGGYQYQPQSVVLLNDVGKVIAP